ncbi:MAG: hypothetical protein ABIG88_03040 [Patescibacteria group bacterium]
MSEKIASVIVVPDDQKKGISVADVFREGNTVYFPCAKEKIGGVYYYKKATKKQKKELLVSFDEYLKELRRLKCEKIIFEDGEQMEV